jgi:hypothetical protein
VKLRDLKCDDKTFKSAAKRKMGSEVKCRSLVECVHYHGFTVMYFVCGLLYSVSCCFIVSLLFAFCLLLFVMFKLIALCFLNIQFRFVFLFLYIFLSILCALCFYIVLCIVSPHAYSCLFSICIYQPLPLGGNPNAVKKISYHISYINNPGVLCESLWTSCSFYTKIMYDHSTCKWQGIKKIKTHTNTSTYTYFISAQILA